MTSRRRQTVERGTGGAPLRERRAEVKRATNETDIAVTLGLGVLGGTVERMETGFKVPHIGWNDLDWGPAGAGMARGLPAPATVYFVHSCAAVPADPSVVAATSEYGGPVVAAVARGNVWAVQFHPEKSSSVGLALLAGFVANVHQEAGTS